MKPERNRTRILRLYKMEEVLIAKHGLTAIELCNCFQVNRRTIYRDISLMQELGIPLCKEEGRFKILGTYKIPSYRPQILALSENGHARSDVVEALFWLGIMLLVLFLCAPAWPW